MIQKETYILLLVGALAFAGAWGWRLARPSVPRVEASTETPPTARITAYEDQIAGLSAFDTSLLLYDETASIPFEALDVLEAIAVDRADQIYAGGGDTVLVLDSQGTVLRSLKVAGRVSSLAVSQDQHLFVGLGNQIQRFPPDEAEGRGFGAFPPDTLITSLAVAGDAVFVADAGSRTVKRLTMDGNLAQVIDGTAPGSDSAGFLVPSPSFDIVPGQSGTLWIVNPGRQRLEEYDHQGALIRKWADRSGMEIAAFCGCCNPAHIARLSDGSIVTSEKGLLRVKLYASRGQFLGVVAGTTQFDAQDVTLDLAVDSRDRILVADPTRRQVRIFERRDKNDEDDG